LLATSDSIPAPNTTESLLPIGVGEPFFLQKNNHRLNKHYRTYAKLRAVGAIHVALADRMGLPLPENQGFGYYLRKLSRYMRNKIHD